MTLVYFYAKLTIMSSDNRSKLNRLLSNWPKGTIAVLKWMQKQGIYQQLIDKYKKSGWVKSIGHGAFIRMHDQVAWTGGIYAIQKQLNFPIHIGAKTSLQLQGYAHYIPLGKGYPVYIFGISNIKLPAWFKNYQWDINLNYITTNLFKNDAKIGLSKKNITEYDINISSPERAIMEILYLIPNKQSFEEAKQLMEGLTTLRPQLIEKLLKHCQSKKVKRLFLFLAEKCNHQWISQIDVSRIDLGQGKRMIIKGGVYNSKYKITIPKNLYKQVKM